MSRSIDPAYFQWAWARFRGSRLWQMLRRIAPLRSMVYLTIELYRVLREGYANPEVWNAMYALKGGSWCYESNPAEQRYFEQLIELLDLVRRDARFEQAFEVGCGDGNFTSVLAPRCETLLAVDVSANALARALERRGWPSSVTFAPWDLRKDLVPANFDLIVVACVLEAVHRPHLLTRVRDKLIDSLQPGGYLLVVSTRHNPVVENSWWGKLLHRGKWIAAHFAEHPAVSVVGQKLSETYAFALVTRNHSMAR